MALDLKNIRWRFAFLLFGLLLCQTSKSSAQKSTLAVGLRIQKTPSFYYENGVTVLYSHDRLWADQLFWGVNVISSRFGSAFHSNAIKQDSFFFSAAWFWRKERSIRPFVQLNIGFFQADYEEAIFDVLPNEAMILSPEIGVGYEFNSPLRIVVSAGYNSTSGNGVAGPGTLYPIFMQMTATWKLINP